MRYNKLISPLTTLYKNLWHHSMYYVSYMTVYEIQEFFSTLRENQIYTVFSLWTFLDDPCMISRKPYMVLVWLPRIHTNHIWPSMITKNHIWPSTKSKRVVWSLTRVSADSITMRPGDHEPNRLNFIALESPSSDQPSESELPLSSMLFIVMCPQLCGNAVSWLQ